MAAEDSESLTIGLGGWAEWRSPVFSGTVRLRFDVMPNGRMGVVETSIVAGIAHSDAVRAIPIRRIEALANTPQASTILKSQIEAEAMDPIKIDETMQQIWSRLIPPAGYFRRSDGVYETNSGFRFRTSEEMQPLLNHLFEGPPATRLTINFDADRSVLNLQIPPDERKPDAFYADVADAYGAAAARTGHPARLIADVNGISVTKVYQWLKEARRRGLLAPATRNARPIAAPASKRGE